MAKRKAPDPLRGFPIEKEVLKMKFSDNTVIAHFFDLVSAIRC